MCLHICQQRVPEQEPERVPEQEPERVPEQVPERVPERVPEHRHHHRTLQVQPSLLR
jgi:hypothetical protein